MKKIWSWIKYSYIYAILLVTYIPLIIVVILSFNGVTEKGNISIYIGQNFSSDKPLTEGYNQLSEEVVPLLNSLMIGAVVTPISVFIATLTCFCLWNSRKVLSKTVLGVSNFSIVSPEVITGLGLSILFISTFLAVGVPLGILTIILAHISFCTPYAIVTIFPRMEKMNRNWVLASYDFGYRRWKTLIKIVIPFLMPTIIGASLIVFTMSFDDFIITNFVRGSTQTISNQLYTLRRGIKGWAVAFGAIMLMIILFFAAITAVHKYFVQHNKKLIDWLSIWKKLGVLRKWKRL